MCECVLKQSLYFFVQRYRLYELNCSTTVVVRYEGYLHYNFVFWNSICVPRCVLNFKIKQKKQQTQKKSIKTHIGCRKCSYWLVSVGCSQVNKIDWLYASICIINNKAFSMYISKNIQWISHATQKKNKLKCEQFVFWKSRRRKKNSHFLMQSFHLIWYSNAIGAPKETKTIFRSCVSLIIGFTLRT